MRSRSRVFCTSSSAQRTSSREARTNRRCTCRVGLVLIGDSRVSSAAELEQRMCLEADQLAAAGSKARRDLVRTAAASRCHEMSASVIFAQLISAQQGRLYPPVRLRPADNLRRADGLLTIRKDTKAGWTRTRHAGQSAPPSSRKNSQNIADDRD
jgi:hypothetical protein